MVTFFCFSGIHEEEGEKKEVSCQNENILTRMGERKYGRLKRMTEKKQKERNTGSYAEEGMQPVIR